MSYDLIFQELLVKNKLVSVHQMILQLIEIFKAKSGMLSELMNDIFQFVERPYLEIRRHVFRSNILQF